MLFLALLLSAATLLDRVVAVYHDTCVVTLSEVREYRALLAPGAGDLSDEAIVREIVLRRMKVEEIEAVGNVRVTEEEIKRAMEELHHGTTPPEETPLVRKLLKEDLLIRKYVKKRFLPQIFITEDERRKLFSERFPDRAYGSMTPSEKSLIDRLLRLEKLNALIEAWNDELMQGITIRYRSSTRR